MFAQGPNSPPPGCQIDPKGCGDVTVIADHVLSDLDWILQQLYQGQGPLLGPVSFPQGGAAAQGNASAPGNAAPTKSLQEILVTARKTLPLDFSLAFPSEQMWVIDANGNLIFVPTVARKLKCSDGSTAGEDSPADPNFKKNFATQGYLGLVHSHPLWALPFPGPEDGVVPRNYHIPNFGISPVGVWVINPGPPLSVDLLSGSWGTGPNRETFNASAYTAAINAPKSGGKAVTCH
jgi:hypothetical protein